MLVWIVWEANAKPPQVFHKEIDAYRYRADRTAQVRHQVYIVASLIEGEE